MGGMSPRRLKAVAACAAASMLALCGSGCAEQRDAGASVILVTVDTLRADRTSAYGHPQPTSPSLERLASRGRRYEWAFSASSSTAPSHASIFTGRYPSWHTIGSLNGRRKLHPSTNTLAELLREQGYRTAAIVSNPILRAEFGMDQGFDSYDDALEATERNRKMKQRYAGRAVDLALEWLDRHADAPFFLWLHLQDPHGPYVDHEDCSIAPGDGAEEPLPAGEDHAGYRSIPRYQLYGDERAPSRYRRRHDCEIAHADAELGRLLDRVADGDLARRTLVIVTADHGEALGEDEFYFAHGHSVGLDQVRVPLLLAGPGIEPGEVVGAPVTNVALFPTVLDYLGLPLPDELQVRSLFAGGAPRSDPVFTECLNQSGVVIDAFYLTQDRRAPDDEEFWSRGNPNNGGVWVPLGMRSQPIAGGDPPGREAEARARELLRSFDSQALEARKRNAELRQRIELTDEQLENLRALGYID